MSNMFNVLYTQYIQQIKLQQIQNYNQKHRDYLLRSGKQHHLHSSKQNHFQSKKQHNNPKIIQSSKCPPKNSIKSSISKPDNNYKYQNQSENQNNFSYQLTSNHPNNKNSNSYQVHSQERPLNTKNNNHSTLNHNSFQNISPHHNPNISQISLQNNNKAKNQANQTYQFTQRKSQTRQSSLPQNQFLQQQENIVLQQCPEGCGRKFKISVLQKHIKICQKVFQAKRKPFKVDLVDDQAKKLAIKNGSLHQESKTKTQKIPKWKKQSQMLRRGLKAQNQGGTKQTLPIQQEVDDRVKCGGCGRKFNEVAAQKHIPGCLKRSKKIK